MVNTYGDGDGTGACGGTRSWVSLLLQTYEVQETGLLLSVDGWCYNNAGDMRMGVYEDDGPGGDPGTLLGQSDVQAIPDFNGSANDQFVTFEMITPFLVTQGQTIWIGAVSNNLVVDSCDAGASPTGNLGGLTRNVDHTDPTISLPDPANTGATFSTPRAMRYTIGEPPIPSNQGASPIIIVVT